MMANRALKVSAKNWEGKEGREGEGREGGRKGWKRCGDH